MTFARRARGPDRAGGSGRRRCRSARAPPPARPVRFTGDSRAFWRLLLRGAVLLAVTLGIYRFWLATDVRRFLWSQHRDRRREPGIHRHRARAADRLPDRDRAPGADQRRRSSSLALEPGRGRRSSPACSAFALLCVLGQFAVYRARRYRLTRTVYRGVRFHQTGSALALCGLRDLLVGADRADARARLSVRAGEPRALQDAQHLLRRPAGPFRRLGHRGCSCAAC